MEAENKPKNYSLIVKIAVFSVALIITGTIVSQGNFLEGVLKLIGAGASQTEEIAITTTDEFMGITGDWWVDSNATLENVEAVDIIPNQPEYPTLTGFLIPLIGVSIQQIDEIPEEPIPESYQDPTIDPGPVEDPLPEDDSKKPKKETKVEVGIEYSYTSPVIDLSEGGTLRSITTLDYRPLGSEIAYAYRAGANTNLSGAFIPIEDTSVSSPYPNSQFFEHQYLQELPIPRYLQLKAIFLNVNKDDLSAIAEIKVAYQLEDNEPQVSSTVLWGDLTKGNPQIAKKIKIDYNELTIPEGKEGSVRINVAANGKEIAKRNKLDLSKRTDVIFEDIELITGEQYVVVLEVPSMDRKILYFAANYDPEANYSFTFGALYQNTDGNDGIPSDKNPADLNGDGSVNSIDYQMFLEQFGK